jgi:hypothetical protein
MPPKSQRPLPSAPNDHQHGAAQRPLSMWRTIDRPYSAWALENDHLRGRPAVSHDHRASRGRWRNERADVPCLSQAMSGSDTQAGRRRHGQPARSQGSRRAGDDRSCGRDAALSPPYSPDLNPIEQAFSKLKAHLRKAAETTVPGPCAGSVGAWLSVAGSSAACSAHWRSCAPRGR